MSDSARPEDDLSLSGKVAIVTGGATLVGPSRTPERQR
jgi:hypothetical protein